MATTQKERTAAASGITIIAPNGGENIVLQSDGAESIHFDYDVRTSSFSRSDNNLVVESDNGGTVTVVDFFAVGTENQLPSIVLEDGTVVASADFLKAQSPNMDVSTAAGPSQSSASSGLGAYDDAAGNLLGGTDRLGSLGTDQWGGSTRQVETAIGILDGAADGAGAPDGPQPPIDDRIRYDARASIFTHDANAAVAEEVSFDGLSVNNIQWHDQAFQDLFDVDVDANGTLTLKLNQAGLDHVAQAGTNDIYGYVTLTTDKGTYTVQVVINENNSLNSHDLDQKTDAGVLAPGGLKHGEWHQGQDLKGGTLESSDLDDRVHYTGSVQNSSIFTGTGNDTITIDQYTSHGSVIDAGAGDNVFSFNDKSTTRGTSALWYGTTVRAGDGNNLISVEATSNSQATGYSAQTGGAWDPSAPLTMTTGSGNDTLNIAVSSQGYASGVIDYNFDNGVFSTINLGDGNNKVDVDVYGGSYASGLEYGVKLITGAGNDSIHITAESNSGKGNALEGGSSASQRTTVDAGDGNNEIVLSGISASGSARGMQSASVLSGSGNDTITVTATSTSNNAMGMENSSLNSGSGNDSLLVRGESTSGAARGMHNSSAVLQGSGTVQVQAQSGSNTAMGMYNSSLAMQQGTATVEATSNAGAAIGLFAEKGMQNTVTTLGTVAVSATSTSGNATGMRTENSLTAGVASKNTLSFGAGENSITATTDSGQAVGVQTGSDGTTSKGIATTDISGAGDLTISATGVQAAGIFTQASAVGSASSTKVDIEGNLLVAANAAAAAGTTSVFGVLNTGRDDSSKFNSTSETSLKAGAITITADGNSNSDVVVGVAAHGGPNSTDPWWAYYKYNESHVLLEGASVSIQVNQAAQLLAQQTGDWSSLAGEAMGLQSLNFSGIDVKASTLDIAVAGKTAHGLYSASTGGNPDGPTGANNIGKSYQYGIHVDGTEGADTFTVAAHSSGGIAAGIATLDVSPITMDGKGGNDTLSITAEAHGTTKSDRAYGMLTGFDGATDLVHVPSSIGVFGGQYSYNTISNMENVSLTAKSAGSSAYGMQAMSGNSDASSPYNVNKIFNIAQALQVTITAQANSATGFGVGMSAHKHGVNAIESGAGDDVIKVSASNAPGEAIGLYAQYSGAKNSITTGGGNDLVTIKAEGKTASGLMAEDGGANTITSTGAATLAVTALATAGTAAGMRVNTGGSNTLRTGGDVSVTASGKDASANYGLLAAGSGVNTIEASKVEIKVFTAGSGAGYGIYATSGGANNVTSTGNTTITASGTGEVWGSLAYGGNTTITSTAGSINVAATNTGTNVAVGVATGTGKTVLSATNGNIDVTATAKSGSAYGLRTSAGGQNSVAAQNLNVTATSETGEAYAMRGFDNGGRNDVQLTGAAVLTATGSGITQGIQAGAGANTISAKSLEVTATSSAGTAHGMYATTGGENTITTTDSTKVTASGAGETWGVLSYGGNTTVTSTNSNISVTANNTGSNAAVGVAAGNGKTVLTAANGSIDVTATAKSGNAFGMRTNAGGQNILSGKSVNVTATSDTGEAYAMRGFELGGRNDVQVTGAVVLKAAGAGATYGLQAESNGANSVTAGSLDLTATSQNGTTYGLFAGGDGENSVTTTGNLSVAATAATSGAAFGAFASGGTNTLNAGGDVTVNATTDTGMAYAMYSTGAGGNTLNGGKIDIIAKNNSGTQSLGMYSLGGGTNTINGTGPVSVAVSSATNAWGLYAGAGSQNALSSTSALSIMTTAVAGQAIGVAAKGAVAQNTLTGNAITLAATAGTTAVGLNAEAGGTNTVNELGGGLTITASGGTSSSAMNAGAGSHNLVNAAGDVSLVAATASGIDRALQAEGGTNTLNISKSLHIDVNNATPGSNNYSTAALFAIDKGVNLIQANAGSNGLEIRITVTAGNGGKAYAMYADTLGENRIEGSEKADFITIKGDIVAIYGGSNSINTGGGDDRVVLDGAVNGGGLTLEMGAGHDILTLKAATFAEFKARYETWLNALMATGHGIESIEVIYNEAWSPEDIASLHTFFGGAAFQNVDVLFPEALHSGTEVHSDMGNVFHEGNFDGTLPGDGHSSHTFASTQDDVVRVHGDVSHTELTFAGGGHDTLSVAGNLIDAHVTTESTYTGTLHVEADGLENANMNLAGGTSKVAVHGGVDSLSSLVLGGGNDTLSIEGNFTGNATMGAGNDLVTLHGSAHGGMVDGGAGNDTLVGDAGNNILVGGTGFDVLTGGAGADTFVWKAGDAGTTGAPSTDVVSDFNIDEGDKLDLSQLLTDEAKDNLDSYLSIEHTNGNTVLHISTSGESAKGHFDQVIVLQNNSLTDEQLMQHLLLTQ